MSRPDVSAVVLPVAGGTRGRQAFGALQRQSGPRLEVLEAPIRLSDGSMGPQARTVSPPAGMALNFAAGRARGEVLAFIRGDLVPRPGWAQALARELAGRDEPALLLGTNLVPGRPAPGPLHCALSAGFLRHAGGFPESVPSAHVAERPGGGLEAVLGEAVVACPHMLASAPRSAATVRRRPERRPDGTKSVFLAERAGGVASRHGAKPAVSVIVPVRGRPRWLSLCMEALYRQDMAEAYEILIAAECSPEDIEYLNADFPWARVIPCQPGLGPGGQRNRAIAEALGDYVVLTDDDCVAEHDWLRTMVETCRSRGGQVVWGWVSTAYPWDLNSRALNVSENGEFRPRRPVTTHGVGGGNMCVPRDCITESGAQFAEGVYGAEEIMFLMALPERARPVVHEPAAVVRHLRHDGFADSLTRQYRLGRGSGQIRARLRIRGSVAARWPFLAPALAPGRYLLSGGRVLRSSPHRLGTFLWLSPLMALHHMSYAAGFAVGALTAGRDRVHGAAQPRGVQ